MTMSSAAHVTSCPRCGTRNRVPAVATGRPRCARCQRDLPWLVEAVDADYDAVVGDSPLPVLLDCWAEWCGPCRTIAPSIERVAELHAGRLKVVKVDVDRAPGVAQRLGVQGIPALFLLRDGQVVERLVGARPLHEIERAVDRVVTAT